jgi:chromosome partitioning protein
MANRVIYAEAALWGATPTLIEPKGPAARDIAAIADEIESVLEGALETKRVASA